MNPRTCLLVKIDIFFIISALIISIPFMNAIPLSTVGGMISEDTTWQGDILITETVVVQPGVTLEVMPGTYVKFQHYRGYREPENRLSLIIQGAIVAEGTPDQPIYFTSDAPDPQNGDWSMVRLESPTAHSQFQYCVFEFGQQGLNVWQGSPEIHHCVFRWNNWEGVYFESFCQPVLMYCQIYENGYNGLAAEQSNTIAMDYCNVWRNGTNGVHIDNSFGEIRRSYIHENHASGISVDDGGTLKVLGVVVYDNRDCGIGVGEGDNTIEVSNVDIYGNDNRDICGSYTTVNSLYTPPPSIDIGFLPEQSSALGYIPGDPQDKYLYVYPDDETRCIVRKIGEGLGLTWALGWDGQYIWTCTLWNHVCKLNPRTGAIVEEFELTASKWGTPSQPWGMTFDDEGYMWIVDFAERRLFKVDVSTRTIVYGIDTPHPEEGGCKGLAWDGNYLCVMGWVNPVIYQVSKAGDVVNTIQLEHEGGGGLAWDGEAFWVPAGGHIARYSRNGKVLGWIYAASEGTWDLTWDGKYLWASQRTNENWQDAKIYQLDILDYRSVTDTATLSIDSHPDAAVYIDGSYTGETPVTCELEEGEYKIKIQKEGYESHTEIVRLSAGERKEITVSLDTTKAILSLDSYPDAAVYINDTYMGETPVTCELEEGEYEIKIEKEGYKSHIEIIRPFPGEKREISVRLTEISMHMYYILGIIVVGSLSASLYLLKKHHKRN